jgi:glycosyltransferase involved in cell wall biosynthesis
MNNPYFSIIVVSLNAQETILPTIQSILNQNFYDYEIIVKDGLSKDNTLSVIPKSEKIHVYTEKDSSIYDAMNQAIGYASGKYLCFLNCGDTFKDENVLQNIYDVGKGASDESIIYGNYFRKGVLFKQPSKITDFYLYRTPLCHQTLFIAKKLFEINGHYNTEYKILADYDHTLCDYFKKAEFMYCNCIVCDYMGEGVSESEKGRIIKANERKEIINRYFSEKQRFKFEFKLKLSFKKLRQKMISDKSPKFIRVVYRKVVNLVNK